MGLVTIPFEPEHALQLSPREPDKPALIGADIIERARLYRTLGPAFTGFWDDVPMVCAGIIVLWQGLGEGWAYTSDLVHAHPIAFHRTMKRVMDIASEQYNLRRLQVCVDHEYIVSRRWIERMGFSFESTMPKFGPSGETFCRYVKFFNERVN